MTPKEEKTRYDTLEGFSSGTDVPAAEEPFSLEEILAEYGAGRQQQILRDVEEAVAPPLVQEETPAEMSAQQPVHQATAAEEAPGRDRQETPEVDLEQLEKELPRAPRPITLDEVVSGTVDAVMEERREEPLLRKKPRWGLFSRREMEDTEQLYPPPEPEEEVEEEPIGPEEDPRDAAEALRREYHRRRGDLPMAAVTALAPMALLLAERQGYVIPYWTGDSRLQSVVLLVCLAVTALLCRAVFVKAVQTLARKRCTGEVLAALSAVVSAADCGASLLLAERTGATPYAAVSSLALVFALWGLSRESRGGWDMFRAAAMDEEPPYLVTETEKGACKQQGSLPGFYTTAQRDNAAVMWQTALLPVVAAASLVLAGLTSFGKGRDADFLLHWSAILAAGTGFALPLCWGLPWSRLASHLHKTGCAVAGWSGAEKISQKRCMILTDADLFPPGTIQLNGVKVYGEEMKKVASYAAAMAQAAGSGLERLFEGLRRSEVGRRERAEDFSFFEEGGWSAAIHGETVLLGTASFMRKMDVRLPAGINLKTGLYLAIDRQMTAVFAVKYKPSENVDYALRMMRRSRITPILAARDPNITPALLKRKFHKSVRVEYPDLTTRVALSEAELDRGMPRALLFREGLLPYAETVAGSRRLCGAVRRAAVLSLLGSGAGTALSAYLLSLGAYELLTPLALEVFLLLWTLPVLVMADWTGRY